MRHFCIKRTINALKFIHTFDPFIKTSTAKGLNDHFYIGVSREKGDLMRYQKMALMGDLIENLIETRASELSSLENKSESETENETERLGRRNIR